MTVTRWSLVIDQGRFLENSSKPNLKDGWVFQCWLQYPSNECYELIRWKYWVVSKLQIMSFPMLLMVLHILAGPVHTVHWTLIDKSRKNHPIFFRKFEFFGWWLPRSERLFNVNFMSTLFWKLNWMSFPAVSLFHASDTSCPVDWATVTSLVVKTIFGNHHTRLLCKAQLYKTTLLFKNIPF